MGEIAEPVGGGRSGKCLESFQTNQPHSSSHTVNLPAERRWHSSHYSGGDVYHDAQEILPQFVPCRTDMPAAHGGSQSAHAIHISHDSYRVFTKTELEACARSRRPRAAPGPDSIPMLGVLKCWDLIPDFLLLLFNSSLNCSYIPISWKLGSIIALPKAKGFDKTMNSLRPITLLNAIPKMLE